jgi:hypothetical protein
MNTMFAKFLGRNYHLAVLICICAFYLCLKGRLSGGEYGALCGGIFSAFRAGDAVVNWIHREKDDDLDETHKKP